MTIRILFLTRETFPTFRPDVKTLFGESLRKQGIFSDIVAMQEGNQSGAWPAGKIFLGRADSRIRRILTRLRLAFDLFSLSNKAQYDAIQVRDRIFGALIGLMAARWRGLPFLYWLSFPFPELWQDMGKSVATGSWFSRIVWRIRGEVSAWVLYRLVLPRSQHVFVQSAAMREMLVKYGIPFERMTPVPMGVAIPQALEQIPPSDDSRLIGRRVIVYLGALERIRHPEIMIEAMALVIKKCPDALLMLVGDSENPGERSWLEGEIQRLGLSKFVIITGWLPSEQAWRYLRAANIGLSPFPRTRVLEVASPTKVCEYLAYGLPVIANDQPEQAFLLQETGGGLCVPMTAEGFANGIIELLMNPVQATQMAEKGRAKIAGLRSYDVLGAQLAHAYRKVLDQAQKA